MTERVAEPGPTQLSGEGFSGGDERSVLSGRALVMARERLRRAAEMMLGITLVNCALWILLVPALRAPDVLVSVTCLVSMGVLLDLALLLETKNERRSDSTIARIGYGYHVARSFAVAFYSVGMEVLVGWRPSPVTLASLTVVAFPLLVPMPRDRLLAVSLLAGSSAPLVLWLHGATAPSVFQGSVYVAISVALAVFCGRVAHGLTTAVLRGGELGPYRLLEPLTGESPAALWRAEHRLLARACAVKVIRLPWLTHPGRAEHLVRFRQEAAAATRLTSPHSVTVYDFGVADDGSLYYVREFLDGETLEQRVQRCGPLSPLEAVHVALQICDSLGEAHAIGLLHRSLTPRQVFLSRAGGRRCLVKVLDFGLIDLEHRLGSAVGRPALRGAGGVAPERLRGEEPSAQTDLFQFGSVLYFALTGTSVEAGRVVPAALSDELVRVLAGRAPIPACRGLVDIVARCLRSEPAERPSSVDELVDELAALVEPALEGHLGSDGALADSPEDVEPARSSSSLPPKSPTANVERPAAAELANVPRHRLERVAVVMASVTALALVVQALHVGAHQTLYGLVALYLALLCLDVAIWIAARDRRVANAKAMQLAAGYVLLRAAVMGVVPVETASVLGVTPARMSFALVLLVLLPFLIPLSPARVVALGGGAALVYPVALALLTHGMESIVAISALNAVTGLWAVYVCAEVVSQLRSRASARRFGSYRLTRLLARGAMGDVWQAEHELLARPAAIKLIARARGAQRHPKALRRSLVREALVTAQLTSPHTVTLYDYGISEEGDYYYAMELLEGCDFEQLVRERGPLSWQDAVFVAMQVCESLAEAHAFGLIHRDLKPANLFSARVGRQADFVKVLDFGLSDLATRLELAAVGRVPRLVGTPGYLAPETLLEQRVDARSDIYQLGCVVFYLIAGRLVFERSTATALAVAHVHDAHPTLASASGTAIPEDLESLVARCLAKRPDERFPSVLDLERALRAVLVRHRLSGPSAILNLVPLAFRDPSGPMEQRADAVI